MDVSIIIVNYNTKDLILQCLKSIYKKTKGVDFEIIVVDNDSKDDSCKAIRENFSEVKIIKSEINLGFGKANNLGAGIACGKYLFLLNSDTILLNNAIEIFFNFMSKKPIAVVCGGALYLEENLPTHSYGFFPNLLNELFFSLKLEKVFKKYAKKYKECVVAENIKVDYITGADMFIKKNIFQEIGGFDKDFFMYYEETELSYRLHKKKYNVFLVPSAKIIHYGQMTNMTPEKLKMYFTSKFLYFKKTKGISFALFIKYWWIVIFLIRAILLFRKKEIAYIKILLTK
jgi:GT2 family glycosyltransferase